MSHGDDHQMTIPLIPAPVAFFAMMFGLAIGIMIGHKKSMMHGMGPGRIGGMGCGDAWGDWAARKKMMGGWSGHHHHGDGMPACGCGYEGSGEDVSDE
jgi:hypothetical protein